jgi:hypothetical protein
MVSVASNKMSMGRNLKEFIVAIGRVYDVRVPSISWLGFRLALLQAHPKSPPSANSSSPNHTHSPSNLQSKSATQIFAHRIRNEHRRFFGFIPSPASPVARIADTVTAAFNVHARSWFQSSDPNAIPEHMDARRWCLRCVSGAFEVAQIPPERRGPR